jgi:hypothetical protein
VDKKGWVGGTGNVNGMQIFHYNSKGIPSLMSIYWKIKKKSCEIGYIEYKSSTSPLIIISLGR